MKILAKFALGCACLTGLAVGCWFANYRLHLAAIEAVLPPKVSISSGVHVAWSTSCCPREEPWVEKHLWQLWGVVGIQRPGPPGDFPLLGTISGSGHGFRYMESRCSVGDALACYDAQVIDGKLYDDQGREIVFYLLRSGPFYEPSSVSDQVVIIVNE